MESTEKWLPVVGYEDTYEVSSAGQVRSVRKNRVVLRDFSSSGGYHFVNLSVSGKRKKRTVHSLVAEAFIGPRPGGYVCRHIDGNPSNNQASNLAWGTYSDNLADSVRHGTFRVPEGDDHVRAKLTSGDIGAIRCLLDKAVPQKTIASKFRVDQSTISNINRGKSWKHVK